MKRRIYMNTVFNYARNKIKKEYHPKQDSSLDSVLLSKIDLLEKLSKENLKSAITCRLEAIWSVQTDNEKIFIGSCIAVILFICFSFLRGMKNIPLNILVLNSAENFFFCFVILSIIFLYDLIHKHLIKRKIFYFALALFFIFSTPHIPILCKYETTQIGDFYEAREYTAKYYVIMSKEPETNPNRKVYTLPAEIERRLDYEGSTEAYEDYYFQEHGETDIYVLNYHINYLYFSNGGYLNFDYDNAYDNPDLTKVIPDKEISCIDYKDDTYYITLTTKKAT